MLQVELCLHQLLLSRFNFLLKNKKVNFSLCLTKHYAMKAYKGVDVYIYIFVTSALVGGDWSASRPGRFTPGWSPRYPLDRRLVGPQSWSGWHGEENSPLARQCTPRTAFSTFGNNVWRMFVVSPSSFDVLVIVFHSLRFSFKGNSEFKE
jgi:hypothetical protein